MKQAQRGDKKAFIKLFELCEEEIYRMAFIYVKNKQDALDIVQETAYRSFKCISNLKEPQYFKTWLIKIAINNSLELIRNRQNKVFINKTQEIYKNDKDIVLTVFLRELIETLNEEEKSVILLRFYYEYSLKEVSNILKFPLGTVKTILYRALKKLRQKIKGDDIQKEINKIEIPNEIKLRRNLGIEKAKSEQSWLKNIQNKKSKKVMLTSFILSCCGLLFCGLVVFNETINFKEMTYSQKSNNSNGSIKSMEKIQINSDISKFYNNINDLIIGANIIIEGNVVDTSIFKFNNQIFTKSKIEIIKDYNGQFEKGTIITFVEVGGITTKDNLIVEDYNKNFEQGPAPTDQSNQMVEIVSGVPVMKKNEMVLIFGVKPTTQLYLNEVQEGYYLPLGAFQGKFIIDGNYIERPVPKDDNGLYSPLKITKEELENKIKNFK